MSRSKKWYAKEEYYKPFPAVQLGDGSLLSVDEKPVDNKPEALFLTRLWPDGRRSEIHFVPPGRFSARIDLYVNDPPPPPTPAQQERAKEFLGPGYRPPHLSLSSVPGNKSGDDYDAATNQRFSTRAKFNEYYKENKLEKVSPTDSTLDRLKGTGGAYNGSAQQFDPAKGPPVPAQFQGVKFHYGE